MKSFLWWTSGVCAAAVGFILWESKRVRPVQDLAKNLQEAWADHHTVV